MLYIKKKTIFFVLLVDGEVKLGAHMVTSVNEISKPMFGEIMKFVSIYYILFIRFKRRKKIRFYVSKHTTGRQTWPFIISIDV